MMKHSRIVLCLALLLTTVACSSSKSSDEDDEADKKKPLPICPQVAIVRDLEEIRDYGNEIPDPSQLVAKAKMLNLSGTCEFKKNGIDMVFDLNFVAEKGPRLGGLRTSFPYFVSIVDPDQTIISKEKMSIAFGFSSSEKVATASDSLHVYVPLPKDKRPTAPNYQILLGFQLTQDQLDVVRKEAPVNSVTVPSDLVPMSPSP